LTGHPIVNRSGEGVRPDADYSRKNSIFDELTCAVWFVKENRLSSEREICAGCELLNVFVVLSISTYYQSFEEVYAP